MTDFKEFKILSKQLDSAFNQLKNMGGFMDNMKVEDIDKSKADVISKSMDKVNKIMADMEVERNEILEMFESFHRSECYFHGKKEDDKMVSKIEKMKYE